MDTKLREKLIRERIARAATNAKEAALHKDVARMRRHNATVRREGKRLSELLTKQLPFEM